MSDVKLENDVEMKFAIEMENDPAIPGSLVDMPVNDSNPAGFSVDSSCIASVPAEEQAEELRLLGLNVYNQATFEDGVLEQVDRAFQQQEAEKQQRLDQSYLKSVLDDIRLAKVRLKFLDKAISLIPQNIVESNKQLKRQRECIIKEKENKIKQLKSLRAKRRGIVNRLKLPTSLLDSDDNVEDDMLDPESKGQLDEIFRSCQETEQEKLIRTGQMTPFGTMVAQPRKIQLAPSGSMTDFERYLLDQASLQKSKKNTSPLKSKKNEKGLSAKDEMFLATPSTSKNVPPLLPPRKRKSRRKEDVGTITIETQSDYKKIRRKPFWWPDPSANSIDLEEIGKEKASSGSEYSPSNESTDEEEADIRKRINNSKTKTTKKNSGNNQTQRNKTMVIDDGNEKDFIKRIKEWKKEQILNQISSSKGEGETKELDKEYEEFEGYKIPLTIWNKLYRYQQTCVRWLWELYGQRCGGIIGDEMGLGKTIQVIAYLTGLCYSSPNPETKGLGPVIIVCPTTVMHQWVKEFHTWWPKFRVAILHESGAYTGTKESLIRNINKASGILITSYSGITHHLTSLLRFNWHYIILDEGHKIRNPDAQITLACKQFRTPNRIILSGSPMQNNLKELWSLFDYVFPGKLGTLPVFMQQFSVPITQGGYANASRVQVETAYRCAVVLRNTISPYLLRRMKADVNMTINLPKKNEQVLFCGLSDEQKDLYKEYLESKEVKSILDGRLKVFVGLTHLRKICNHADLYSGGPKLFGNENVEHLSEEMQYGFWKRSGKMIVVESVLKLWHQQNHRVLLFSQSKQMLDILERFVKIRNYSYLRMDGNTTIGSRQPLVHKFNTDPSVFVFLLTTRVGGLGVNLTGANKVILFDPDWNPSTDMQARERAWRIGQLKDVTVYRLLTAGTIEEKIYHRQIFKQFLTNRVLKDPRQRRFFKSNQLFELFTLKVDDVQGGTETSNIFAGTGSNVKVKPLSKEETIADETSLSSKKIERMRELAKKLSQKLVDDMSKSKNTTKNDDVNPDEYLEKISPRKKAKIYHGAKFEGRRHKFLLKTTLYKQFEEEEEEEKRNLKQDELVLRTLFTKAGVHGALKHDKIMDASDPDYMLVEGEAEKVANEAVKALKLSQRQCHRADAGIPTWTGSNGQMSVIKSKSRFGKKKTPLEIVKERDLPSTSGTCNTVFNGEVHSENNDAISSKDLLKRMKERNITNAEDDLNDESINDAGERVTTEHDELLADIRNYIAFQCEINGQATTMELLDKFKDRLAVKDTAVFKALLLKICCFFKDGSGDGIWKLNEEFR